MRRKVGKGYARFVHRRLGIPGNSMEVCMKNKVCYGRPLRLEKAFP
jgi:hypothetical protein